MGADAPDKPVIALVGGVAAGKSAAAEEFAALGCAVIDADAIGHQVLEEGDIRERVREVWGEGVFAADGRVDRKALGRIVFAEVEQINVLNRLMQPRIRRELERQIAAAKAAAPSHPAVVLDAAILFEAGWDDLCTHVLFVDAPEDVRHRRAAEKGWDEAAWRRREKAQISLDSKKARCYGTLDNSSSVSHLREQIRRIFSRIVPNAGRS